MPEVARRILALNAQTPPTRAAAAVRFVAHFLEGLRSRGLAASPDPWPAAVPRHLVDLFHRIVGAPGPDRLSRLARVAELMELVGRPPEITALDESLFALVGEELVARESFRPDEIRLIAKVVAVSKAESRRSRWWISSGMRALLDAVERHPPAQSARPAPVP